MAQLSIPAAPKQKRIVYSDLAGVDLSSDQRNISKQRASYCVNMMRKYTDGATSYIETRPGITLEHDFGDTIYGIYFFKNNIYVHAGNDLYKYDGATATSLSSSFTAGPSVGFIFDDKLYILDGAKYWACDGSTCAEVTGFVPTTSIGRGPTGGGTQYQSVNLLSDSRKNTFRADGTSTVFFLDAPNIDSVSLVTVDGVTVPASGYTVNTAAGSVTFASAPAQALGGNDNVEITYVKAVSGYSNRIKQCTLVRTFDNRVFVSGNSNFPNYFFHSELNDPTYFADIAYYQDGADDTPIMGIEIQDGMIITVKKDGTDNHTVFKHTPITDYTLGKVYPSEESVITVGAVAKDSMVSFRDDLVFLSADGLNGITYTTVNYDSRILRHRSTLIDGALLRTDLRNAKIATWNGYLLLLVDDVIYAADGQGRYRSDGAFEYEWYVWEGGFAGACCLKEYVGSLYIGYEDGRLCSLSGLDDDGDPIVSTWISRAETGDNISLYKTVKQKGALAVLKTIPNSTVNVYAETNNDSWHRINAFRMGGFDFNALNFSTLSFGTADDNVMLLELSEKKWEKLRLKFESDNRFGLSAVEYLVTFGNFLKE